MPPVRINHKEFDPPEALRDTIKCFWYDKVDPVKEQLGFEVVPDGYTEIIFYFGSSCSILVDGTLKLLPSPFMMGLLSQPARFFIENSLEIIGIRCFPWTVFNLLELPSDKNGVQTFKHPVVELQPFLQKHINKGRIQEAITLVEQYFVAAHLSNATDGVLVKVGTAIRKANGSMPVNRVAEAANATVRTLERKFKESSGHTVKDVAGLIRFEQVRNQLLIDPDSGLAGLAQELGYTDQSHLTREFKRYSGTTPAAFARKAKKDSEL